jgi:DNA primase
VEGYMDMIMPYIHGVDNGAASLGTALTVDQIRLLRRYTHNVVMLFDTDAAGQSAIIRSLDLLIDEDMNVRVATLAQGADPDSFIRQHGVEAFNARIEEAHSVLDFKFDWLTTQHDLMTVEGNSKIAQELLGTIARFKSEVAKYDLTRALAKKLNVPESVLLKQAGQAPKQQASVEPPVVATKVAASVMGHDLLLALFLKDPAWVKAALAQIGPEDFPKGPVRRVVEVIWSLASSSDAWSVSDVLMALNDEANASVVTSLISLEEGKLTDPDRVFQDCIGKIQKEKQKKIRLKLIEAISQAEASKDMGTRDRLAQEYNELIRGS